MIKDALIAISLITNVSLSAAGVTPSAQIVPDSGQARMTIAERELNLTNRIPNSTSGNLVFADNILFNLHYIKGDVEELRVSKEIASPAELARNDDKTINGPQNINWEKTREPFEASFYLLPNEVFAFHENVLPEYKDLITVTSNSHFDFADGYKALNGLSGNGVCHLASLINWVAKEAGLESISFVSHDFSPVPGVPREYGASIYYSPTGTRNTEKQNLYIKNNFDESVKFEFKVDEKKVSLEISK